MPANSGGLPSDLFLGFYFREMFFCITGVGRHLKHSEIERRKKIIKENKKSEMINEGVGVLKFWICINNITLYFMFSISFFFYLCFGHISVFLAVHLLPLPKFFFFFSI